MSAENRVVHTWIDSDKIGSNKAQSASNASLDELMSFFFHSVPENVMEEGFFERKLKYLKDKSNDKLVSQFDFLISQLERYVYIPASKDSIVYENSSICFNREKFFISGTVMPLAFAYGYIEPLLKDSTELNSYYRLTGMTSAAEFYDVFVKAIDVDKKLEERISREEKELSQLRTMMSSLERFEQNTRTELNSIPNDDRKASKRKAARQERLAILTSQIDDLKPKITAQEGKVELLQRNTIDSYFDTNDIIELKSNLARFIETQGEEVEESAMFPSLRLQYDFHDEPVEQHKSGRFYGGITLIAALSAVTIACLSPWIIDAFGRKEPIKPPRAVNLSEEILFNSPEILFPSSPDSKIRITSVEHTTKSLDRLAGKAFDSGEYEIAEKHLYDILKREPNNPNYLLRMGKVQLKLFAYRASEDYFRKALPLTSEQDKYKIKKMIGEILFKRKKYIESIGIFEEVKEDVPNDGEVDQMIAQSYYMLGQYEKTAGYFKSALRKQLPEGRRIVINDNLDKVERFLQRTK